MFDSLVDSALRAKSSSSFVAKEKTKKINSYGLALGAFAGIECSLTWKTGHKLIFSLKILFFKS